LGFINLRNLKKIKKWRKKTSESSRFFIVFFFQIKLNYNKIMKEKIKKEILSKQTSPIDTKTIKIMKKIIKIFREKNMNMNKSLFSSEIQFNRIKQSKLCK